MAFYRFHEWMAQIVCPIDSPCMRHGTSSPTLQTKIIIRNPDDKDVGRGYWFDDPPAQIITRNLIVMFALNSHDIVMWVMTDDRRLLRGQKGQLNTLNTFVDQRSCFTLLRQNVIEFFFLVSWILYLECRITNSTKEYFLFSQHQPED